MKRFSCPPDKNITVLPCLKRDELIRRYSNLLAAMAGSQNQSLDQLRLQFENTYRAFWGHIEAHGCYPLLEYDPARVREEAREKGKGALPK
jgi:hypothetical protein